MNRLYVSFGAIAAAMVVFADQLSKYLLLEWIMVPPRVVPVNSFFNLVLSWNKGVTFGLFNHGNEWNPYIFATLAIVIVCFLMVWLVRAASMVEALAIGLVIGGAIGNNMIDRLRFGAVVDFLDFYVAGYHWYAFNIADSAIVCGVGLLLLENVVRGHKKG